MQIEQQVISVDQPKIPEEEKTKSDEPEESIEDQTKDTPGECAQAIENSENELVGIQIDDEILVDFAQDYNADSPRLEPTTSTTIRLHRVAILDELIVHFKSNEILDMDLKFEIVNEIGADASGVSREIYTEFWKSFMDRVADGEDFRVPAICPEYGMDEWTAIGRILVKGYRDAKVFPMRMAEAFMVAVVFGEHAVTPQHLIESFSLFLNESERTSFMACVEGNVAEEQKDILIDILEREGSHSLPQSPAEMKALLIQTAHKCLIQNSAYALEAMRNVVPIGLKIQNTAELHAIYEKMKPSPRKIIKLLQVGELDKEQTKSFNFFKQFVNGQNMQGTEKLLQFMTGSKILSVDKISVEFVKLSGLQRRPVAHTCGPVLELPSTYNSYRELRSEFEAVLNSGYLSMDII